MDDEYLKDPKTTVIEGLSSALNDAHSAREYGDLPELNLTDAEEERIVEVITQYIKSRFHLTWKP